MIKAKETPSAGCEYGIWKQPTRSRNIESFIYNRTKKGEWPSKLTFEETVTMWKDGRYTRTTIAIESITTTNIITINMINRSSSSSNKNYITNNE